MQEELSNLFEAEEAHDRGDYGRVPRSPKMALTPTHSAPGATMNRSAEMAIAVSIVYYLEDATLRNLDMVVNCQIGLISQDGPADAQRAIFEAMLASGLDQPLFNFRVKDTWKCELWVINQDYISSTMYRFVDGKFSQFMHRDRMKRRGQKINMECHLWPNGRRTVQALPC